MNGNGVSAAVLVLSLALAACGGTTQSGSAPIGPSGPRTGSIGEEARPAQAADAAAIERERRTAICANIQDAYENRDYCLGVDGTACITR